MTWNAQQNNNEWKRNAASQKMLFFLSLVTIDIIGRLVVASTPALAVISG